MRAAARLGLLVGLVRLVLGVAGLGAAAAGHAARGAVLLAAGLGAILTVFTLAAPGGRRRPAVIPRPRIEASSIGRALAITLYPSTYGVALLTAIALFVNDALAAFLAGVLLGMAAVALIAAFEAMRTGSAEPPT